MQAAHARLRAHVPRRTPSRSSNAHRRRALRVRAASAKDKDDVIVIGAGWGGLAAAKCLCEAGCSVTLIDAIDDPTGATPMLTKTGKPFEPGTRGFWKDYPNIVSLTRELGIAEDEAFTEFTPERLLVPRRPRGDRSRLRRLPRASHRPSVRSSPPSTTSRGSPRRSSVHGRPALRHAGPQPRRGDVRGVRQAHRARALHTHGSEQEARRRFHPSHFTRRPVQAPGRAQRRRRDGAAVLLRPGAPGLFRRAMDQDQEHRGGAHRALMREAATRVRPEGDGRDVREGSGRRRG